MHDFINALGQFNTQLDRVMDETKQTTLSNIRTLQTVIMPGSRGVWESAEEAEVMEAYLMTEKKLASLSAEEKKLLPQKLQKAKQILTLKEFEKKLEEPFKALRG